MMRWLLSLALCLLAGAAPAVAQNVNSSPLVCGYSQTTISSPPGAGSDSTSVYTMVGLAGSFTPGCSGPVTVTISGSIYEPAGTTATIGLLYQIYYGTGSAPANGAAVTGTAVGVIGETRNGATITAADFFTPFAISYTFSPGTLTNGTTYWIDLGQKAVTTAHDQGINVASVSVTETP